MACNCNGVSGWIPANSKIKVITANKLEVITPPGWFYIGSDTNGNIKEISGGSTSISCDCTQGSGCNPSYIINPLNGTAHWGCDLLPGCSECKASKSARIGGTDVEIVSGGYIDLGESVVDFANKNVILPGAFGEMFQMTYVQNAIKAFLQKAYQGLPFPVIIKADNFFGVPDGYSLAVINVFGRASIIPVPTVSLALRQNVAAGTQGSCSCTAGECTAKEVVLAGVNLGWKCEAEKCSGTCTLTVSSNKSNGNTDIAYKAQVYYF